MAIAVKATANLVKVATPETEVIRFTVGTGGVTAGSIVYHTTDGVALCDGSDTASPPIGIALTTQVATQKVGVAVLGLVECVTGAAEGSQVYPVDGTPGAPSHTASTKKYSVGVAVSATTVFVQPRYVA